MKKGKPSAKPRTFDVPMGRVEDELYRKFQLSLNEIDELKASLAYVEERLTKEINIKEELVIKAEVDKKQLIDTQRRLREQEELNRIQAKNITSLSEQMNDFVQNQDNIVKHLKDKFEDYTHEMKEKDEKLRQMRETLLDTNAQLMNVTKERDMFMKQLDESEGKIKERDEQIKRLKMELGIAEKTIEQFINVKEQDISSFFDDDTIYTDPKKIESILSNMDETKKENKLPACRPYLIQKMAQNDIKQKEIEQELEKEPDLKKLPDSIQIIVQKFRSKYGLTLGSKHIDMMMIEVNRGYNDIKLDKIAKIKAETKSEVEYLKKMLALLIPLDKDKARTEIQYLRSELRRAREDLRRLNIIIRRKFKGYSDRDSLMQKRGSGVSEDMINDASTDDEAYKSNSRFIENALTVAENAVNEGKGLNSKINYSISNFQNKKHKNYSTWREEDEPEDLMSEDWLISEINTALKDSNENVNKMMYASRLHLTNNGMQLLK